MHCNPRTLQSLPASAGRWLDLSELSRTEPMPWRAGGITATGNIRLQGHPAEEA